MARRCAAVTAAQSPRVHTADTDGVGTARRVPALLRPPALLQPRPAPLLLRPAAAAEHVPLRMLRVGLLRANTGWFCGRCRCCTCTASRLQVQNEGAAACASALVAAAAQCPRSGKMHSRCCITVHDEDFGTELTEQLANK